jgi:hypothetical protein
MRRHAAIAVGASALAAAAALALGGSSVVVGTVTAHPLAQPAAGGPVLARAKVESPDAYRAARAVGARIAATPDGRSFYVQWPPTGRGGRTIVTFHGYLSTAFDGFGQWQAEAARQGYRLIAIHWRLGRTSHDSYQPPAMLTQARILLRRAGVAPGQALVHGYSSAASRMYGLAALDRRAARPTFALYIGDAGGALRTFPMWRQVFGGPPAARPLRGSHWVLFCGGRDPDPNLTGCPIMRRTRTLVRARGGTVDRFIVDPRTSHGGFHQNPANQRAALAVFARLTGG